MAIGMKNRKRIHSVLRIAILALVGVTVVFPFYILLIESLHPNLITMPYPVELWPKKMGLDNYALLFAQNDVGSWLINSLIIAGGIGFLTWEDIKNHKWHFKNEFKSAIQNFGEHVLLLRSIELLEHIESVTDLSGQRRIGYDSGPILYRNLNDFDNTEEYRKTGSWLDRYFVKGLPYRNQNEWRVIIDGAREPLKANCGNGFLLQTFPFKYSMLMRTTELLNGEIEIGN